MIFVSDTFTFDSQLPFNWETYIMYFYSQFLEQKSYSSTSYARMIYISYAFTFDSQLLLKWKLLMIHKWFVFLMQLLLFLSYHSNEIRHVQRIYVSNYFVVCSTLLLQWEILLMHTIFSFDPFYFISQLPFKWKTFLMHKRVVFLILLLSILCA